MLQVKSQDSIFNGDETFPAGKIATVSGDQAKRVVLRGGDLVDGEGNAVPLADAVNILRISTDDLSTIADAKLRDALSAAIQANAA